MATCEFCEAEYPDNEIAEGTTFYGCYCIKCLELVLAETKNRISELKKLHSKSKNQEDHLRVKQEFEDALKDLLGGPRLDEQCDIPA